MFTPGCSVTPPAIQEPVPRATPLVPRSLAHAIWVTPKSSVAAVDFPRYAEAYLAGRLPIDRLIDRRLPLDDLEDAFDRLRAGQAARQIVMFD